MSLGRDAGVARLPSDEEKYLAPPSPRKDAFLVEWDGENDPLNPRNLSPLRKWFIVVIVSMGSLLV
jgi:hypothetical protein